MISIKHLILFLPVEFVVSDVTFSSKNLFSDIIFNLLSFILSFSKYLSDFEGSLSRRTEKKKVY